MLPSSYCPPYDIRGFSLLAPLLSSLYLLLPLLIYLFTLYPPSGNNAPAPHHTSYVVQLLSRLSFSDLCLFRCEINETVRNLHRDLVRKYELHGPRVEQMWRSLRQEQREEILRVASRDRAILDHPLDTKLSNIYKFIPEWNLRDIASPSSELLRDIFKHRATTLLQDQYGSGVNAKMHLGGSLFFAQTTHNKMWPTFMTL